MEPFAAAQAAAQAIAERTGVERHDVLVVLGSGWADAVGRLGDEVATVSTADLPGFPASTVAGHGGTLRSLSAWDRKVLVSQGRVHLYEGNPASAVVHGVRAAILAGCRTVILTNAAGSLRADVGPGSAVLISDHLNMQGETALDGPLAPPPYDTRFVDQSNVYSPRLREIAREAATERGEVVHDGVYAGLRGPTYETPAEIRMLRTMGADLVGMSTVLEAQAATHMGAEVFGLSLVTNLAAGMQEALDHGEVLDAGAAAGGRLGLLLRDVIDRS